ncbi:hypothetical protein BKA57DRAFT_519770 [Linnemannia elongata]|nr:hypothetical protein BKA57DRAFT_519770 [Linnemannia elongata]
MDSLSCLPSEILHLILQELARDSNVGSLAAILQTSKYLATATLPVLYNNLFQDNFHGALTATKYRARQSCQVLVRMLLSQLSLASLSPVMLHALGANKTATQPTKICPSLDYFAHIRHLNLRPEAIVLDHFWSQGDPPSEASACMQGPEFSQIYQTYSLLQSLIWRFELTCEPLHIYYRAVLYREINWHLTSRILEQLKSISISVSDLNRFYSNMSRLGSLEHMEFILDEAIDYSWDYFGSISGELMSSSISREVEPLPAMIQFVREHTRRFPGCLKTVSCSNGGLWHELEQKWPEETKLEILGLLPPLRSPTSLHRENIQHIALHLDSTDLSHIQEISCARSFSSRPWFTTFRDNLHLIQRCRALKSLEMDTLGPGTFKWAVQEKKALDSEKGVSWLDKSRSAYLYLDHGLVSLEKVHLKDGAGHPLTDELDDIAFAFDQTLKSIRFSSFCLSSAASRPIHLGRGWLKLPALEHVSFYTRGVVLDRNFFKLCPSLKSMRLYDGSDPDRCQDVLTCLPADLPCLESLNTSHGSLDYQDVAIETMMSTQARAAEIVRTLWTWDWHLPSLNHLALTGEFAYQFQFRMLNGCPALEKLDLNNKTFDGRLDRVLSYADLFLPGSIDSNDDNSAGAPRQAVVAPALQCLRLMGSWKVDDSLLPQFLTAMTPNLDILDAFGLKGFTLKALADVVKTQPNTIKKVYFRCPEPSPKSIVVNAGLLHHVNVDSMKRREEARLVRVHFEEATYFVMKYVTVINDGSE